MRFLSADEAAVRAAAELIRAGGLAAFPTETVYGLGGDAFNTAALARIFEAKRRPRFDPLIIHIAAAEALELAADLSVLTLRARQRLDKLRGLWPGPLTLILPKRREVPDLATSGLATAAIRFPDHPAAQMLIRLSTGAVAAPSANLFGRLSPTRAEHVRDQLGDRVDIILDGGPARIGIESTVLDLAGERPRLLRFGGTPRERLEALIGPVEIAGPVRAGDRDSGPPAAGGLESPGQLTSHYAPRTPVSVYRREDMTALDPGPGEGFLFFDGAARKAWAARNGGGIQNAGTTVMTLSETGDMIEAAAALFDMLH
ncbi:MAG: threonylcarbamoyl-AMP synthase, partial [Treponema sp.]|nr:threonylcarbamoyl-AMP synthase [Treponema sp.]